MSCNFEPWTPKYYLKSAAHGLSLLFMALLTIILFLFANPKNIILTQILSDFAKYWFICFSHGPSHIYTMVCLWICSKNLNSSSAQKCQLRLWGISAARIFLIFTAAKKVELIKGAPSVFISWKYDLKHNVWNFSWWRRLGKSLFWRSVCFFVSNMYDICARTS